MRKKINKLSLILLLMFSWQLSAQEREVTGTVKDEEGVALPGVTVQVKNTSQGKITDFNGEYAIAVTEGATLKFSSIGFITIEVEIGDQNVLNVSLKNDVTSLDEVVLLGYGSSSKRDITGAVSSVGAENLENRPVLRVDQMLQGKVAGADIKSVNGAPGSGTTIRIRGARSINATNEPLYVIDGMVGVGDLNSINPEDIESIQVLKDASATAIYGSRGANGVILISTKNGVAGEDRITINYNAGVQSLPKNRKPDLMNAPEFVQFIKDAREEALSPSQLESDQQYQYVKNLNLKKIGEGTDWVDEVTRIGQFHNLNLSSSGGTEKLRYYLSGNYADQEGIVIGSGFKRTQFRANIDKNIGERVQIGTQINLSRNRLDETPISFSNWWNSIMTLAPTMPVYKEDGSYYDRNHFQYAGGSYLDNPVAVGNLIDDHSIENNVLGNFYFNLELMEGLKFNTSLGVKFNQKNSYYYSPTNMPQKLAKNTKTGNASLNQYTTEYLLSTSTLNFEKSFSKHNIDAVVGFSYQTEDTKWNFSAADGFVNDVYKWDNMGAVSQAQQRTDSYNRNTTIISFLGRFQYDYDKKYYLTVTGRNDGSSNFAKEKKWGFFPSAAVKWRLSEEELIKNLDIFQELSIRASYGLAGNQGISPYSSLARMSSTTNGYIFNNTPNIAYYPGSLPNNNLSWEISKQLNLGVDFTIFNGRLTVGANYYNTKTKDLLLNVQAPRQTGFASRLQNLGKTFSRGFEFNLESSNIESSDFNWKTNLVLSTNKQEIVDLGPLVKVATDNNGYGGVTTYYEVGVPLGALYGAHYEGTWKSQQQIDQELAKEDGEREFVSAGGHYRPGRMKYRDINGDGELNQDDMPFLGTPNPKLYGSIRNTFRYKNWDLALSFNGSFGHKMYNNLMFFMGTGGSSGVYTNQFPIMKDRFHPERNSNSDVPGPNSRDNIPSTYLLQDASFIRLSNVVLGYTIDSDNISWIDNTYIYLSGDNLWLWSDYNNFDPEVNASGTSSVNRAKDDGVYPNSRTITAGIKLTI